MPKTQLKNLIVPFTPNNRKIMESMLAIELDADADGVLEQELNTVIDAKKEKVLVKLTDMKRPRSRRTKKNKNSEFDKLMSKTMKITKCMENRTKGPEPEEIASVEEHKNVCVGGKKLCIELDGMGLRGIEWEGMSTHLVQANDDINIDNDSLIHRDMLDMEVSKEAKEQEVNRDKLEIVKDKDTVGKDCWARLLINMK